MPRQTERATLELVDTAALTVHAIGSWNLVRNASCECTGPSVMNLLAGTPIDEPMVYALKNTGSEPVRSTRFGSTVSGSGLDFTSGSFTGHPASGQVIEPGELLEFRLINVCVQSTESATGTLTISYEALCSEGLITLDFPITVNCTRV